MPLVAFLNGCCFRTQSTVVLTSWQYHQRD